jgi:hypothetical protein
MITPFNPLHGYQAFWSNNHTALQAIPSNFQFVFGRGIIHNISFEQNWDQINIWKYNTINNFNQRENQNNGWISKEYNVEDQVLSEIPWIHQKLSSACTGSYPGINV